MSQHRYFTAIRHYWLVLAAAAVLGALAALGLSLGATPLYTATTKLYFSPSFGNSANDLNQGSTYTQNQMLSFAQLAESPAVLDPIIAALGLDTTAQALGNSIVVTAPQNTVILDAAVTNADPALATRIANEFAKSVTTAVAKIAPTTTEKRSAVSVEIIAPASTPSEPSSPDTRRNLLLGTLIGLIVGTLAVMLRESLDKRVRTAEILSTVTGAPLLGTLARPGRRALMAAGGPIGESMTGGRPTPLSESYRRMSVHLAAVHAAQGGPLEKLSFLVTSSVPGEGKSEVALGLAIAFAERGRRVLLVDADLRHPGLAGITGLETPTEVTGMLTGASDDRAIVRGWRPGLDILLAGPASAEPSELVASDALARLIGEFAARYEVLVIDTAPVNPVADAVILGSLVDGAVVVADSTRVLRAQLAEAIDSLLNANVAVLGVALNRMPRARGSAPYGAGLATAAPSTAAPSNAGPSIAEPSTAGLHLHTAESSTAESSTAVPSTAEPASLGGATQGPLRSRLADGSRREPAEKTPDTSVDARDQT